MNELIGKPVRSLQTMLRGVSYLDENVLPVVPDGIFGRDTSYSLKSFQRANALPATGNAELETWNALRREYSKFLVERDIEPLVPSFNFKQKIMPGEANMHMHVIQAILNALEKIYDNIPHVDVTGIHDENSVNACKWFQRVCGLEPTGIIDADTWRHLAKVYSLSLGDGVTKQV